MDIGTPLLLRKLILKEWLKALVVSLIALLLIYSVGDLVSGLLRRKVTASEVFINYFLSIPWVMSIIIPFACLLATLFSLHKLRRTSELVAIFAAGFQRNQVVFSILQVTSLVAAFQLVNVGYIDPFFKRLHKEMIVEGHRKFSQAKLKGLLVSVIGGGKIWYRSDDHYVSYSLYDKTSNILVNPTFYYFDDDNNNVKIIRAEEATGNESGLWVLKNAQVIKNISGTDSFPEVEKKKELQLSTRQTPSNFARIDNDLKTLSPVPLFEFVWQIKRSGLSSSEYEIFLLEKVASGLLCFVFALMPIGIILAPNPRGSSFGKNALWAMVSLVVFFALQGPLVSLGSAGKMHPIVAVSATSVLFFVYFLFLLRGGGIKMTRWVAKALFQG